MRIPPRQGVRATLLAAAIVGPGLTAAGPARAQANDCAAAGPMMQERAKLMQRIESFKKKKPTPTEACSLFSSLAANGAKLLPWIETNGEWCHVPADFSAAIKGQQDQIVKVRAQACGMAAKEKQMMDQARKGGQGNGPLGGGDEVIGGSIRMPQGAL